MAVLAEQFLKNHGARQLVSFVQRCAGSGPWSEAITVNRKQGENERPVTYSKLEYELVRLQNTKRKLKKFTKSQEARLNELLITTSPQIASKTDDELKLIAEKWIENNRANTSLPAALPDFAAAAYEKSKKPRKPHS